MPIFPLDRVHNAVIDQQIELVLEEVRREVAAFPFADDLGGSEAALEAFDAARPRLNVLLAQLRGGASRRGIDISAGLGFLPVALKLCGIDVVATEVDPALCALCATQGIDVLPYRIGEQPPPFPAGTFDFLVFGEVLEHLKLSPLPVLRELVTLLRPGGRFLLTTPNVARLSHIEALAAGENFLEPFPEELPLTVDATDHIEHVREYSVREVLDALEAAGLIVEDVLMTGWGEAGYTPLANPFANDICVVLASKYHNSPPPQVD